MHEIMFDSANTYLGHSPEKGGRVGVSPELWSSAEGLLYAGQAEKCLDLYPWSTAWVMMIPSI